MLRFFRTIRKKIIEQDNVRKYLWYALGEILLVMIGILLALQVNNWNNNRIIKKNEKQLSQRLLEETRRNIYELGKSQLVASIGSSSILSLLHLVDEDYSKADKRTVDSLIFNTLPAPRVDFNLAVLNEALSTGQLANFQNDTLKNILYSFPSRLSEVQKNEQALFEDNRTKMIPLIYDHASLRQIDIKFSGFGDVIKQSNLNESDNRILLQMRAFENTLDNQFYLHNRLRARYHEMGNTLMTLEALLNAQIQN